MARVCPFGRTERRSATSLRKSCPTPRPLSHILADERPRSFERLPFRDFAPSREGVGPRASARARAEARCVCELSRTIGSKADKADTPPPRTHATVDVVHFP